MKECWDLKGCPASHYLKCQAYERNVSCWMIKQGCLCHANAACGQCQIYQEHLSANGQASRW